MVDADGVRAQFLHQGGIASALASVDQRVGSGQLVGNTLDKELRAIFVEELVAIGLDGGDGLDRGDCTQQGKTGGAGQSHDHGMSDEWCEGVMGWDGL